MEKMVTATVAKTTVTVKVFNMQEKSVTFEDISFAGELNAYTQKQLERYYKKQGVEILCFYKDSAETTTETFAVPAKWYFENAEVMEKRPNGDYISRTAKGVKCAVWLYNSYTDETENTVKFAEATTAEKAQKLIEKDYKHTDYRVLTVDIIETIEQLYVMPMEKFLKKAERVEK